MKTLRNRTLNPFGVILLYALNVVLIAWVMGIPNIVIAGIREFQYEGFSILLSMIYALPLPILEFFSFVFIDPVVALLPFLFYLILISVFQKKLFIENAHFKSVWIVTGLAFISVTVSSFLLTLFSDKMYLFSRVPEISWTFYYGHSALYQVGAFTFAAFISALVLRKIILRIFNKQSTANN